MKPILALTLALVAAPVIAVADVAQVYWTDRNNGTVSVTDVASGNTTVLVQGFTRLQDVDLDTSSDTLYFAEWGTPGPPGGEGSINSVGTDGTGLTTVLATGDAVHQLALDAALQRIYFTRAVSYESREISRVDMSGANYTQLAGEIPGSWFYSGLALDTANNLLYWGDIGVLAGNVTGGSVNSSALDGTSPTPLTPHVDGQGRGFAIDLDSQTIFLTSHDPQSPGTGGALHSYDIGSGTLTLLISDPTSGYWDIEIDPVTQRIWWADAGRGEIRSANFDGSDVQVELSGLTNPYGIALDTSAGAGPVARFAVTKTFSDGSIDEVEVTLTCNTGLPLEQMADISGGGSGVNFVVTDFIDGTMDCEVTETGHPAGYTPIFNDGAGCVFEDVTSGQYVCSIFNQANPGVFTVYKEWELINDGGDAVFAEAWVTIYCDAAIVGGAQDNGYYTLSAWLGDNDSLTAMVDTTLGAATCWAYESLAESGVESSDDCGSRQIPAGGSSSCTFVNTVFFEAIPTLSQYGLALLALLMLGVGLVGFRRFA